MNDIPTNEVKITDLPDIALTEVTSWKGLDPLAGEPFLRIPSGQYKAQIISYRIKKYARYRSKNSKDNGRRVYFKYKILEGPYVGTILEQYYVYYDIFSNKTDYYQAYLLLTGGKEPLKRSRMSPKSFINAIVEVHVGLTKRKFNYSKEDRPEYQQYSVVREITKILQRNMGGVL